MYMRKQNPHVIRACKLVGSQSLLAAQLKVTPPTVNQWVKGTRPVPAAYCKAIEQVTNGEVTRSDLRPTDFWLIWPDLPRPVPTTTRETDKAKAHAKPDDTAIEKVAAQVREPNTPRERRDPAIADRRVSERSVADRRASVAAEPVQRA
jgi:DNA-binding transcriptional regulator YdaS (Cro superfamily)